MSSHYWIKLYEEILDDSKMATMPDRLWRRTIEIFLLAGKYNKEGTLPPTHELAWALRLSTEELEFDLRQIEMVGIIERLPDGGWLVNKFAQRQAKMTDAKRSQSYRDRQHYNQYYNQKNVTLSDECVTQITDTYTDTPKNSQKELQEPSSSPAKKNGDHMEEPITPARKEYLAKVEKRKKDTEEAMFKGLASAQSGYAHFSERLRPVVERMEKLWHFKPPRPKTKEYAFWVQSCEEILEACDSFGVKLLDDLHVDWRAYLDSNNNMPPYSVSGPRSLVSAVRGKAALMRGGNNAPYWKINNAPVRQSILDV